MGDVGKNPFRRGGMDIFWNYTLSKICESGVESVVYRSSRSCVTQPLVPVQDVCKQGLKLIYFKLNSTLCCMGTPVTMVTATM